MTLVRTPVTRKDGVQTYVWKKSDGASLKKKAPPAPQPKVTEWWEGHEAELCYKESNYDFEDGKLYIDGVHRPIAPEGSTSAVQCSVCENFLELGTAEASVNVAIDCDHCGDNLNFWSDNRAIMGIRAEHIKYLDPQAVLDDEWYHITFRKNWFDSLGEHAEKTGENLFVHAGQMGSVKSRLAQLRRDVSDEFWGNPDNQPVVYKLSIRGGLEVWPTMPEDEGIHPKAVEKISNYDRNKYHPEGVTRYINVYEDPGSVSIMLPWHSLKVTGIDYLDKSKVIANPKSGGWDYID